MFHRGCFLPVPGSGPTAKLESPWFMICRKFSSVLSKTNSKKLKAIPPKSLFWVLDPGPWLGIVIKWALPLPPSHHRPPSLSLSCLVFILNYFPALYLMMISNSESSGTNEVKSHSFNRCWPSRPNSRSASEHQSPSIESWLLSSFFPG